MPFDENYFQIIGVLTSCPPQQLTTLDAYNIYIWIRRYLPYEMAYIFSGIECTNGFQIIWFMLRVYFVNQIAVRPGTYEYGAHMQSESNIPRHIGYCMMQW